MSILTIVRHRLRAARIRRMEQDIEFSRELADRYIAEQTLLLNKLRKEHDRRTAHEIASRIEREAKRELIG